jgi:NAD(P)-dependent dehydrogenase (short-subunit alcohol dehydrogenase family)
MTSVAALFKPQPKIPPLPPSTDFSEKTIIITGSNTSLGLQAARQFLRLKAACVVIAVRSVSKGEVAAAQLGADPAIRQPNPRAGIKVMHLDLDSYQSVVEFSQQVKRDFDILDILLLNAGVNLFNYQESRSGHERVMQVNLLSNAVLALELLPLLETTALKRGSPSHLSIVSSLSQITHGFDRIPIASNELVLQYIDDRTKFDGMHAYANSKLLVSAFVQELAERVSADKVIINNMCPGLVKNNFDRQLPWYMKYFMKSLRYLIGRSVEDAARTLVYAAGIVSEESHGSFISNNEIVKYAFRRD